MGPALNPVGEPDALNAPVRFDEGEVETGHGGAREAPATEKAGNRLAAPKQPRHLPTLLFPPSRVALGVTPQGSHRSVRAQLTHTARQVMDSLPAGTLSGPPPPLAADTAPARG